MTDAGHRQYDQSFRHFQSELAATREPGSRRAAVNRFLSELPATGAPLIENDYTAVFLYHGAARRVSLIGDMTEWDQVAPLERLPGTDLFYLRRTIPAQARMEYQFMLDDDPLPVRDGLNPHLVLNGFGGNSELAMPLYRPNPLFAQVLDGTPGGFDTVEKHELPPGRLPYGHTIYVYRPPGYSSSERYPVVYLNDGSDFIEYGHTPHVLTELIGAGRIRPLLAVFIEPPNRGLEGEPNRMTEYGLNDDYVAFVADEVAPFMDRTYATLAEPAARLVTGVSYGGLVAAFIAFSRPDRFGLAYGQSGYHGLRDDSFIHMVSATPPRPVRLFIDIGLFERCVGKTMLAPDELDFLLANRRLNEVLAAKGYDYLYREYPEGHTWGNWRNHLVDALEHFFGSEP